MLNDKWCEFVLNEGIMPPSLARLLESNYANSHNAVLLARILKERESFDDLQQYPEITKKAETAFLSDEEITDWLKDVDDILAIIVKDADNSNRPDLLNGAFLSFIKTYPLVSDYVKKKYLPLKNDKNTIEQEICQKNTQNKPWKLYNHDTSSKKINEFAEYMQKEKHYRRYTIQSYCSLIKKFNDNPDFHILDFPDIWKIEDASEMEELYNKLKSVPPDYITMNNSTQTVLFYSLKCYIKFLEYRQAHKN